jgi:hypothetical protein
MPESAPFIAWGTIRQPARWPRARPSPTRPRSRRRHSPRCSCPTFLLECARVTRLPAVADAETLRRADAALERRKSRRILRHPPYWSTDTPSLGRLIQEPSPCGAAGYLCFFRAFSSQLGDIADLLTDPADALCRGGERVDVDLAQVHLLIDFDTPFVMPFGTDGALIFFSGLRVLLRSRIARPPAIPARATLAATSGVFAFEATRETVPPALLAAPRPLVAALRPVDFARDFALGLLERFRAWLPWPVDFA